MSHVKLILKILLSALVLCLFAGAIVFYFFIRSPLPTKGEHGPKADALAQRIQRSVQRSAWTNTGAVSWSIFNRDYLWDLRRGLVRVQWDDGNKALFDIKRRRSLIYKKGKRIEGAQSDQLLDEAYQYWLQDRFLLEPTQSFFQKGVIRHLIPNGKKDSLFITFQKVDGTLGDSFQFYINENSRPIAMRIWSEKLPIHGLHLKLQDWTTLKTGLKVSQLRSSGFIEVPIKIKADRSLRQLLGKTKDPFEEIQPDPFDPSPTSQPNILTRDETKTIKATSESVEL